MCTMHDLGMSYIKILLQNAFYDFQTIQELCIVLIRTLISWSM